MSIVKKHATSEVPAIELTAAALKRVISYLGEQNQRGLRLSVKKTGCSGLSYVMDYVAEPPDEDIILNLENNYFISVDKKSYPYIRGVTLDYVKQGVHYKFIFKNPNQTGQCGCGESFTVDF
ncbi:MAG: iron-sulfur cluster assembly accessory protein [Legionellaceae bacterium]|nr:iron-sulfur cluster assembly accessory protein [Legionellaceae bacterium]